MIGKLLAWWWAALVGRFAVSLHADHLLMKYKETLVVGGVYAWRVVAAVDRQTAAALAQRKFESELRNDPEVLNAATDPLGIRVEECLELKRFVRWRGSALVFYVDTDDSEADARQ